MWISLSTLSSSSSGIGKISEITSLLKIFKSVLSFYNVNSVFLPMPALIPASLSCNLLSSISPYFVCNGLIRFQWVQFCLFYSESVFSSSSLLLLLLFGTGFLFWGWSFQFVGWIWQTGGHYQLLICYGYWSQERSLGVSVL